MLLLQGTMPVGSVVKKSFSMSWEVLLTHAMTHHCDVLVSGPFGLQRQTML